MKKIFALSLLVASSYSFADISTAKVFEFDGNADDALSDSYLSVTGPETYIEDRLGNANGAIYLNNESATSNFGTFVEDANGIDVTSHNTYSISMWFKTDIDAVAQYLISGPERRHSNERVQSLNVKEYNPYGAPSQYNMSGGSRNVFFDKSLYNEGGWNHVEKFHLYNEANNSYFYDIYVNGTSIQTAGLSSTISNQILNNFTIGTRYDNKEFFTGGIDDLVITSGINIGSVTEMKQLTSSLTANNVNAPLLGGLTLSLLGLAGLTRKQL